MNLPVDLTIIVPVYNGSNYIFECLQSIKGNRSENIEVLIVNDGSNDDHLTRKIVKRYFPEFKYIELISNMGVAQALNIGIENASGTYISWISHDDRIKHNYVKETQNYIKNCNNKIFIHDFDIIDPHNNLVHKDIYLNTVGELGNSDNDIQSLFLYGRLNGCTLVIHRDIFLKYGKFNQAKKFTQDYDYWSRLINKEIFTFTNKNLIDYRIHDTNGTKENGFKEEGIELWSNLIQTDEFSELLKIPEYMNIFLFYLTTSPFKEILTLLRDSKRYTFTRIQLEMINKNLNSNLILFKSSKKFNERSLMDIFLLSIIHRLYGPIVYRKDVITMMNRLELSPLQNWIIKVILISKKLFNRLFWKILKKYSNLLSYTGSTKYMLLYNSTTTTEVNTYGELNRIAILENFFSVDYMSSFFSIKKYQDHKFLNYIKKRIFILKNMQLNGNYIILDKIDS
jgi:teichuronic acid biosynthesis glycosyltransferase TuaG